MQLGPNEKSLLSKLERGAELIARELADGSWIVSLRVNGAPSRVTTRTVKNLYADGYLVRRPGGQMVISKLGRWRLDRRGTYDAAESHSWSITGRVYRDREVA